MSPGHYTEDYAKKCAIKRQKSQERLSKPSVKRRRLILKQERAIVQTATETLEGSTYQSGIGHEAEVDICKIPDLVARGIFKPISPNGQPKYVALDLETTDLIRGDQYPHITQLAAKEISTGTNFNRYIVPKIPISASAERVTKINMVDETSMIVNGIHVQSVTIQTAINEFSTWLSKFDNVFLVAHNGRQFDFPVLVSACVTCGLYDTLISNVTGLVDSLPTFKTVCPNQSSYKQEDLARSILSKEYDAHNAIDDVNILSELLSHLIVCDHKCLTMKSFTLNDIKHSMDSNKKKKKKFPVTFNICFTRYHEILNCRKYCKVWFEF